MASNDTMPCPSCGYDVGTTLADGIGKCPECGVELAEAINFGGGLTSHCERLEGGWGVAVALVWALSFVVALLSELTAAAFAVTGFVFGLGIATSGALHTGSKRRGARPGARSNDLAACYRIAFGRIAATGALLGLIIGAVGIVLLLLLAGALR